MWSIVFIKTDTGAVNLPYVIVAVSKETTKDVNCQNTQCVLGFYSHNCVNAFIQNCVSDVFQAIGVGSTLQYVKRERCYAKYANLINNVQKQEDQTSSRLFLYRLLPVCEEV